MGSYKNGIILLSGGLDSTAALAACKKHFNINLALTFDYGQLAVEQEISSAKKIAEYYGIAHKIIKLDWMKDLFIKEIPVIKEKADEIPNISQSISDKVWVPNRNALFINIAAAFADSANSNYDVIVIGVNKEEAQNFPDNSSEFISSINQCLQYSTKNNVSVFSPLNEMNKQDIFQFALENNAPLEYIYSCYKGAYPHCGQCESCIRLKNSLHKLDNSVIKNFYNIYFGENNEL